MIDERVLDTHIKNIRKALGENASVLKTVIRRGYKAEDKNEIKIYQTAKKVSLHYNFRNNNCVSAGNGFYLSCNTRQFKGFTHSQRSK